MRVIVPSRSVAPAETVSGCPVRGLLRLSPTLPVGGRLSAWNCTVTVELPVRPSSSVARTRTLRVPAGNVRVSVAPSPSSNAPSSSRSQANVTPRPGLRATSSTDPPARGAVGVVRISGVGRRASHPPVASTSSAADVHGSGAYWSSPAPADAAATDGAANTEQAATEQRHAWAREGDHARDRIHRAGSALPHRSWREGFSLKPLEQGGGHLFAVPARVPERVGVGLGALEEEVEVVLPREADAAVDLE